MRRLAKNFVAAMFECLPEAAELIPLACAAVACVVVLAAVCVVGDMVYQLMFDPNSVNVESRLDTFSIDPNKWFPRS